MSSLRYRTGGRGLSVIGALLYVAALGLSMSAYAQTRNEGPWWPSAEWGADDQAGASNRITEEKVLEALQIVSSGRVYDLGQVYEQEMPLFGSRSYSMVLPAKGPAEGQNQLVANEEFLTTQIGQVGSQLDGLGHIGQQVTMDDGSVEIVFYNGVTASEMDTPGGLQRLGIEYIKPIITRGILIDVARYKGVSRLANSYEVTIDDILGALENQGMSADDIRAGDAVFFRYGWSSLWSQPAAYNHNPPGIGLDVARWAAEMQLTLVGSDSWCSEVVPNPDSALAFPVHQELMMKNGILNVENLQFDSLVEDGLDEFLFILTPLQFKGATGSPVRPIAIR